VDSSRGGGKRSDNAVIGVRRTCGTLAIKDACMKRANFAGKKDRRGVCRGVAGWRKREEPISRIGIATILPGGAECEVFPCLKTEEIGVPGYLGRGEECNMRRTSEQT